MKEMFNDERFSVLLRCELSIQKLCKSKRRHIAPYIGDMNDGAPLFISNCFNGKIRNKANERKANE
ncbi:hypothetical protein AKG37_15835 [Bacillus australimaris]|uniref:Uncharacterized protein n=1 Tax=Bacillus australimaris TaxID=1326968 RepID=A0ABR5MP41_9BACI|nr:hypothetical protein AKG37_15835 [Bacillus australimaris]